MITPELQQVLFICTGNSARSIMAEGLMNQLGRGRYRGLSAGSHPKGFVEPLAIETLREMQVPDAPYRSKSWDEFAAPGAPPLHFVFTVCDRAAGETCPVWPGQPITAHWGVPDPVATQGPEQNVRRAYRDVAFTLKRRIELMLALPLDKLSGLALRQAVTDIGRR